MFSACSSSQHLRIAETENIDTNVISNIEENMQQADNSTEDSSEFTLKLPYNICFDTNYLKRISFGKDTLNDTTVLFKLFPAPIDENCLNFNDDYNVAYWQCSSCKPQIFIDNNYYDDSTVFYDTLPYDFNYTSIVRKIEYTDRQGIPSCLYSFTTSRSYPPCGRISSGLLSLALFKKTQDWKLQCFNPFVNYQGSFATADAPDSVIVLPVKDELFTMHGGFANGPSYYAYTPIAANLYFFESTRCSEMVKILNAFCINNGEDFGSKWSSKITVSASDTDTSFFKVVTKGVLDKKNIWGAPLEIAEINEAVFKKLPRKFNFTIVLNYSYIHGKAKLENKSLKINFRNFIGKNVEMSF